MKAGLRGLRERGRATHARHGVSFEATATRTPWCESTLPCSAIGLAFERPAQVVPAAWLVGMIDVGANVSAAKAAAARTRPGSGRESRTRGRHPVAGRDLLDGLRTRDRALQRCSARSSTLRLPVGRGAQHVVACLADRAAALAHVGRRAVRARSRRRTARGPARSRRRPTGEQRRHAAREPVPLALLLVERRLAGSRQTRRGVVCGRPRRSRRCAAVRRARAVAAPGRSCLRRGRRCRRCGAPADGRARTHGSGRRAVRRAAWCRDGP